MIGQSSVRGGALVRRALGSLLALGSGVGKLTASARRQGHIHFGAPVNCRPLSRRSRRAGRSTRFSSASMSRRRSRTPATVSFEVYPPGTTPGDYGTFLVVANALYAPDFTGHGGTASGSIGTNTVFTPISQSPVTRFGNGRRSVHGHDRRRRWHDGPHDHAGRQLRRRPGVLPHRCHRQPTPAGRRSTRSSIAPSTATSADPIRVTASSTAPRPAARSIRTIRRPARIEQIVPLNGGNNYYETGYNEVWAWIGTHAPFPDTCDCTIQEDNGSGVSWNITVPAGGSVERSNLTVFSPIGTQPLFVTKTADEGERECRRSRRLHDHDHESERCGRDAEFDHRHVADGIHLHGRLVDRRDDRGSERWPAQVLTWAGPFTAPASGTVTLHFGVTVSVGRRHLHQPGDRGCGYGDRRRHRARPHRSRSVAVVHRHRRRARSRRRRSATACSRR